MKRRGHTGDRMLKGEIVEEVIQAQQLRRNHHSAGCALIVRIWQFNDFLGVFYEAMHVRARRACRAVGLTLHMVYDIDIVC